MNFVKEKQKTLWGFPILENPDFDSPKDEILVGNFPPLTVVIKVTKNFFEGICEGIPPAGTKFRIPGALAEALFGDCLYVVVEGKESEDHFILTCMEIRDKEWHKITDLK